MTNREKFLAGQQFYLNQLPENIFCYEGGTMYNVTASGSLIYHAYIPRMTSRSFTIHSDIFCAPTSVKCQFNMITFLPVKHSLNDYMPYVLKGFAVGVYGKMLGPGAIYFLGDEWIRVSFEGEGTWCYRNDDEGLILLENYIAFNKVEFLKEPADYDK